MRTVFANGCSTGWLKTTSSCAVNHIVKPIHAVLVALAALLVTDAPRESRRMGSGVEPCPATAGGRTARPSAERLAALVSDLQAVQRRDASGTGQSTGSLWVELDRLRRDGQSVRQIEWYVSDLEGSLRRGADSGAARRHILNNLSYEVEALKSRQR